MDLLKYSPDQPRDAHGRFGSGGDGKTASDSMAAAKHEIKQVVAAGALTAAVSIGTVLAPEAAATAAGVLVVKFATGVAEGLLIKAGASAALHIAKGMGVDTSRAEAAADKIAGIFKAAQSDADLMSQLRPHLEDVADQACDALVSELTDRYPTAAGLDDATRAVTDATGTFKAALRVYAKSATFADQMRWQAGEFRKMSDICSDQATRQRELINAHPELAKDGSLAAMEASFREAAEMADLLARSVVPLWMQELPVAGSA